MSTGGGNADLMPCGHPVTAVVRGEEGRQHDDGVTMSCGTCDTIAKESSMRALERSLAYEFAVSIIDANCLPLPDLGLDHFHLGSRTGPMAELVEEAARYLEWRGLIERHANNPDWIGIRDESEADR